MNEVEFEDSAYYTGPDVTDALVEAAEMRLGVQLTPSAGNDTVMLDYRDDPSEPAVAYIDEDGIPRVVAQTFAEFMDRLELAAPPSAD